MMSKWELISSKLILKPSQLLPPLSLKNKLSLKKQQL